MMVDQVDVVLMEQKEMMVIQVILDHVEEKVNALTLLVLLVLQVKKEIKERR